MSFAWGVISLEIFALWCRFESEKSTPLLGVCRGLGTVELVFD